MSEEDIRRILEENNPINDLSKPELEILKGILQTKKDKTGTKIAMLARKWRVTAEEKAEANKEYLKICEQLRAVENRINKS